MTVFPDCALMNVMSATLDAWLQKNKLGDYTVVEFNNAVLNPSHTVYDPSNVDTASATPLFASSVAPAC